MKQERIKFTRFIEKFTNLLTCVFKLSKISLNSATKKERVNSGIV